MLGHGARHGHWLEIQLPTKVLWLDLGVDELLQGSALRKLEDFFKSGDVSSPQPLLEVLLPVLQGQHVPWLAAQPFHCFQVMQLVICGPPEDPATGLSVSRSLKLSKMSRPLLGRYVHQSGANTCFKAADS